MNKLIFIGVIFYFLIFSFGCSGTTIKNIEGSTHAIKDGKEKTPSAYPRGEIHLQMFDLPDLAYQQQHTIVKWKILAPSQKLADNSSVYWSIGSNTNFLNTSVEPKQSGYVHHSKKYLGELYVPKTFTDSILVPKGVKQLHIRAYTHIDGKHYWSKEYTIPVQQNTTEVTN